MIREDSYAAKLIANPAIIAAINTLLFTLSPNNITPNANVTNIFKLIIPIAIPPPPFNANMFVNMYIVKIIAGITICK